MPHTGTVKQEESLGAEPTGANFRHSIPARSASTSSLTIAETKAHGTCLQSQVTADGVSRFLSPTPLLSIQSDKRQKHGIGGNKENSGIRFHAYCVV